MKLATTLCEIVGACATVAAGVFAFLAAWSLMAGLLIFAFLAFGASYVLSAQ